MITYDQFITKWNGRGIDFDGAYGDQCMDLMHQYIFEVLGLTDGRILAQGYAKDVYLNFNNVYGHELFDKIPNTPTGVPQKGDILLFNTFSPVYGVAGHVSIFISGDVNKLQSFDQNYPVGRKCHIQNHDYRGSLGWLRRKATTGPTVPLTAREQKIHDIIWGGDNDADARYKEKLILPK